LLLACGNEAKNIRPNYLRLAPVTNCMELPRMITGRRQSDRARFVTSSAALWQGNYCAEAVCGE